MEIATKCPICESLANAVPVYPSNVDESSFSTEIFSARRLQIAATTSGCVVINAHSCALTQS